MNRIAETQICISVGVDVSHSFFRDTKREIFKRYCHRVHHSPLAWHVLLIALGIRS